MNKQPARKTAKTTKAKDGAAPKKQHITTEDRHRAFAREYVALAFNATQAAIAAGYSAATAASQGARLLRDAKVQAYVKEFSQAVVERAEVKAEDVVRRLNDMLMADPRELVEVYVACCRHCYGVGHEYQYTLAEYNAKHEKWLDAKKAPGDFPELGGVGYDANKAPVDECPECFGAGQPRAVLKDTRRMSRGALALFAGAKEGKYGLEIQVHSQLDVVEKLMRYHGLYKRDTEQQGGGSGVGHFELHFVDAPARENDPRDGEGA
jgi:hypothetical protein